MMFLIFYLSKKFYTEYICVFSNDILQYVKKIQKTCEYTWSMCEYITKMHNIYLIILKCILIDLNILRMYNYNWILGLMIVI